MADPVLDRIHIRDLHVRCIVGIYPHEREERQDVILNLTLYADLRKACQSDNIDDTVDYKRLKKQVLDTVQKSSFYLIERLAEEVARMALGAPGVQRVTVSVDKPGALRFARSVAVEITREH
ncbi:MAG: dihydroneopterin aldolase [Candidatus Hydrogenedentota bacterium]